jgi:hypothetical protein
VKEEMNNVGEFFTDIKALTELYYDERDDLLRKKVRILRRLPMLLPDESEPFNTILICPNPAERVLIMKEMEHRKK